MQAMSSRSNRHVVSQRQLSTTCFLATEAPLTRDRFPNLQRGNFAQVTEDDVKYFQELLQGRVITDEDELSGANTDWLKICRGMNFIGSHKP